jgi:hypothetical protein
MKFTRIAAIALVFAGASFAWVALGTAISARTRQASVSLHQGVQSNWGRPLVQEHPAAYFLTPHGDQPRQLVPPDGGGARVALGYEPKRRGLLWHRTYKASFDAEYQFTNPAPISQTLYVAFRLPDGARFDDFAFELDGRRSDKTPEGGVVTDSVILQPGASVALHVAYTANGLDTWHYTFGQEPRVRGFRLDMVTDFGDIDIPVGSTSPDERRRSGEGMSLRWSYTDVLGAGPVGMAMPDKLNPGPVAARMTFFAPVSLLFYFAVLVLVGMVRGVDIHPVNYFFLAAGCFAFQLLFAYLVDLVPVWAAFATASAVSLGLVTAYLWRFAGAGFAKVSALAQFAYMVLFSSSFFFDGLTGITITAGAIATLALLMAYTAKTDWSKVFARPARPAARPSAVPPVPGAPA